MKTKLDLDNEKLAEIDARNLAESRVNQGGLEFSNPYNRQADERFTGNCDAGKIFASNLMLNISKELIKRKNNRS